MRPALSSQFFDHLFSLVWHKAWGAAVNRPLILLVNGDHVSRGRRVSLFQVARDCADILATGQMDSGVYTVHVNNIDINVYCDMTTEAGGWLVTYTFIYRLYTGLSLTVSNIDDPIF